MALVNNNNAYKERNLEFLEEYAERPGVKRLFNGVLYREITKGKGEKPTAKSVITVHYKGTLINGKPFDATEKGRPATFPLRGLIEGWKTALKEMPVGSRWEIVIPFNLGYGSRGAGIIKPFSTLIFDITLLRVE
jgi:FKBP-type peptidyl-prolyl cis-trans isomerase